MPTPSSPPRLLLANADVSKRLCAFAYLQHSLGNKAKPVNQCQTQGSDTVVRGLLACFYAGMSYLGTSGYTSNLFISVPCLQRMALRI